MGSSIHQQVDKLIDGRGASSDTFWKSVDELVAFLYMKYPYAMIEGERYAKQERESNFNVYGSNKDKTLRKMVDIPNELDMMLKIMYRDEGGLPIKDKEFTLGFAKRYPQFKLADKL